MSKRWHDFGRDIMPEREPVTCKSCGAQMRSTGKNFPHVEFRERAELFDEGWSPERPFCR